MLIGSLNLGYEFIYLSLTLYGKMIALSAAKLKMFFAGKRNFSLNKAKKEKKTFLWKVWINANV